MNMLNRLMDGAFGLIQIIFNGINIDLNECDRLTNIIIRIIIIIMMIICLGNRIRIHQWYHVLTIIKFYLFFVGINAAQ